MRMALRSKKKLGFIDGIISIPEGDSDKEEECTIYGIVRSYMIQQELIPKLRIVLAQISKEEQHKNLTRIGDYSSHGAAFAAVRAATRAVAGATAAGRDRRSPSSKFYCTYYKKAGQDITGYFQHVGYPEWWLWSSHQLATGRGISPASNNKGWRGRPGREGWQQQQTPRTRATDGGRLMEAWANSASVRQGRLVAESFNRCDLLAGEEDNRGLGRPIYSDRPNGGLSTSSNGPGHFPTLTADQWS
ncbi:hypothetical protein M9H77_24326 [Catharanthus roseus]|uniref:Uncharacterized protein n=1 Tax=Catharanthus roseus TaxID=4058 RepID=A0ACC0AZV2_CATRO|nr:hypothetical protein M9H77_24326 [Catharanthus roseus]